MQLSKCISAMCIKGTPSQNREIIIKALASNKILYKGLIKDTPKDLLTKDRLKANWEVLELGPDRERRGEFPGVADYNLPYLIIVF